MSNSAKTDLGEGRLRRVALIGNPNTGKSTLFNCLTGMRQKVGNYPGVTVQKKTGIALIGTERVEINDLPGTYSLAAASPDERVVVDALRGEVENLDRPDLALCIVDATNLQRNLFLAYQIGQLGLPMVLALNYWDSAKKRHIEVDVEALKARLGIPIVPISASRAEGVAELKEAMAQALEDSPLLLTPIWPETVSEAVEEAREVLPEACDERMDDASIMRGIFEGDEKIFIRGGASGDEARDALESSKKTLFKGGLNPANAEAVLLYRHITKIVEPCINTSQSRRADGSESIDGLLTHRWWGLVAFLALMYLVFQSVYSWAGPFMDVIESGKGLVQGLLSSWLAPWPIIQSLVTDGIIEGVGAVVIFLPQILILFFFITLLEDTGYMSRAAFLMDKLFSWCGLSGKSFVPLLSSYACAIPGVMATRTIQDPKARLVTILVAPFMSCSARLPVYVLLIGAFIEPKYGAGIAGATLFGMHFVGLIVAMPFAYLMNRFVLKTPPQPFLLELPNYQIPKVRDVFIRMYNQGKEFVVNAGTVIFAITIVIWALLYFPRSESIGLETRDVFLESLASENGWSADESLAELESDEDLQSILEHQVSSAYIEQSFMGRIGKMVQPVFAGAGFDWKITVGVIASFPAREVLISTLGIIYSLGGDVDEEAGDLRETMASQTWSTGPEAGLPIFTIPVVIAIMVFFALCQQCGATLAIIAQETSWKWAGVSFGFMTLLAWLASILIHQIGTML
ncbi:MAG: ferrous iron transport protein B [Opitutales bacterium]|nr:ferrous iron transport protein B [Opitutales bacterium]MBT5166944.1 ferrous iron transport protein B [Opitutales bacterium]MBT5814905.1 ferrous iron transport protein B [Opitutales bacterium]